MTTDKKEDLAQKMIDRADADALPVDHDLRVKAAAFTIAANGFCAETQTHNVKQFMGAWARARRTWCDYSGEPLI